MRARLCAAVVLVFSGCLCKDEKADDDGGDQTLPPCDPPLAVEPSTGTANAKEILRLAASGGTGAYRFEIVDDQTGGLVDARNGNYLAGDTAGTDTIEVTDDACEGVATATISVGAPFTVRPLEVELPPRGGFEYEVTGGTGAHECEIVIGESGGSVANCRYTAGASEGDDVVAVRDTGTGEEIRGVVRVRIGASIQPDPSHVAFPLGETWTVVAAGGSGVFDLAGGGGILGIEGSTLEGTAVGRASVTVTDHFTGQSASVTADVVATQTAPFERVGDQSWWGEALGPGDLNGDGYADAIYAQPEADIDAASSGAVFVYAGGPDGLVPEPARVFTGAEWWASLGRGVAVADFDGDGRLDLAAGAPGIDQGGGDSGVVWIWRGVKDGFFEDEPWIELSGNGWDNFGWGLAPCDFDGDGRLDLAVGAIYGEDGTADVISWDQGAIRVFRGTEDGFAPSPEVSIYGDMPDGSGAWVPAIWSHLGYTLDAGDVNGDGLCDLVAGNPDRDSLVDSWAGDVRVYRGDADELVHSVPSLAWSSELSGEGGQFGRNLSVGDVDGDGLADIAAGHHGFAPDGTTWSGAVRIFRGRAFGADATGYASPTESEFVARGNQNWDQFGYQAVLGDVDGDGAIDLLSGNVGDEVLPEDWAGQGTVAIFSGSGSGLPDETPTRIIGGLVTGDAFGQAVAPLGDVDGDGNGDLFVFAGLDPTLGWWVGRPFYVSGDEGAVPSPLELPGEPSGAGFARAVAILGDVTGDGREDMLVGAPDTEIAADRYNGGAAYLYRGTADGFEETPAATYGAFPGNDGWEQFASGVANVGDFDGDGNDDFAILAPYDEAPDFFDPLVYANPDECPGRRNDSGAVYVWKGVNGGVPAATPSFVWYGPWSATPFSLAGGLDFDGDGLGDFVVGMSRLDGGGVNDTGGFSVVSGRASAGMGITVVCDTALAYTGREQWAWIGHSVAPLGRLDADACDEIAIAAAYEDFGADYWDHDQGSVRVLYGWGPTCLHLGPEMVTLRSGQRDAQAHSVAGGGDVDGDGVVDLAIGSAGVWDAGSQVGAAWIVPGSYLSTLVPEPVVDGAAPSSTALYSPGELGWRTVGRMHGEGFGTTVAFVPDASGSGREGLAVGSPAADIPGTYRAGGVRVYAFDPDEGFEPMPIFAFGGESSTLDGQAGSRLAIGTTGATTTMLVGGWRMDAVCQDCGAAFAIDVGSL